MWHYLCPLRAFVFFFSSRRRHTRSLCDWSSDVCSSDLEAEELAVQVLGNEAEHVAHALRRYRPLAEGEHLIENRQAVPHAAVRALRDEVHGVLVSRQALGGEHLLQPLGDRMRADAPEVEALESREDGCRALRDLLRLRGREHEH